MAKEHITVCICTYKRPGFLKNLLSQLESQKTGGGFDFSITIVDNDCYESARRVVEKFRRQTELHVRYFVEPEQNIALARNRAIANTRGEYVALIDDDEFPDEFWLATLYNAIKEYEVEGVLGPVEPYFREKPPNWVVNGKFFTRKNHPTGFRLSWWETRTGNALLQKKIFTEAQQWFDPDLGSGGEDRDFFRRKIDEGHVFVWSNEARVHEIIPANRWRKKTLIKRALLRGKAAFFYSDSKTKSICISILAIGIYAVLLPFMIFAGYHMFMKYIIKFCDHLGKISALIKLNFINEKYISGCDLHVRNLPGIKKG